MTPDNKSDGNGRPTAYSEEIGMKISDLLFDGKSLHAICRDPDYAHLGNSAELARARKEVSPPVRLGAAGAPA